MEYNHAEAFCLMRYKCGRYGCEETLWNARDGVTPFMIPCSKCGGDMQHVHWHYDKVTPDYLPKRGMRVFVDSTPQINDVFARAKVREGWNREQYPMKDAFPTAMDAVREIQEFCEGQPFIMTV